MPNEKITTEEFIERARLVHGDRYDYSKVVFVNISSKVIIICSVHGEFEQSPDKHLRKRGCPNCAHNKKKTQKEVVSLFVEKHGNLYDYSKVVYVGIEKYVTIICKKHGDVSIIPSNHIAGSICPKCALEKRTENKFHTPEHVLSKFKELHGDRYDYSKVIYINNKTKVEVICKEHGSFMVTPVSHLQSKGCPRCVKHKNFTVEIVKESFIKRHGLKYDYSLFTEYKRNSDKIKIICPVHGVFITTASSHEQGSGCSKCAGTYVYSQEEMIVHFNEKHDNFYDHSLINYVNMKQKIKILCPIHGTFEQSPSNHLFQNGCPKCRMSTGEKQIEKLLKVECIDFVMEKTFEDCRDKAILPFDFYLPNNNICIEYNGIQHYKPIKFFGGEPSLITQQRHDEIKLNYCKDNDINFLVIKYTENVEEKLIEFGIINKKESV